MNKVLRYTSGVDNTVLEIISGINIGQVTYALGDTYTFARFNNSSVITAQTQIPLKTEWESMYNFYHWTWADITVTFVNLTNYAVYVGMMINPLSVTAAPTGQTWTQIRNELNTDKNCRMAICMPSGLNDRSMATLKMRVNMPKVTGQSLQVAADLGYYGAISASPTKVVPLWLHAITLDSNNVSANTFIGYNMKVNMGVRYSRKDLEYS